MPEFDTMKGLYHNRSKSFSFDDNGVFKYENETFDGFYKTSTNPGAVYTYYYTDECNKITVNEIFDFTDTCLLDNLSKKKEVLNRDVNNCEKKFQDCSHKCDCNHVESDLNLVGQAYYHLNQATNSNSGENINFVHNHSQKN
jgi:hypothetical protein